MRKKIINVLSILALFAILLCACGVDDADNYEKLNKLILDAQSDFTVSVTMEFDSDVSLLGVFEVVSNGSEKTVNYSIEQFVELDISDVSENQKEVITGTATVQNGNVFGGDNAEDIDFISIASPEISFVSDYFDKAKFENGSFSADVKNCRDFLNTVEFSGSEMTVTVKFGDSLKTIELVYTSTDGAEVKVVYDFSH